MIIAPLPGDGGLTAEADDHPIHEDGRFGKARALFLKHRQGLRRLARLQMQIAQLGQQPRRHGVALAPRLDGALQRGAIGLAVLGVLGIGVERGLIGAPLEPRGGRAGGEAGQGHQGGHHHQTFHGSTTTACVPAATITVWA
ncbi:hypothetical protein V8F63_01590 [Brevundimonas sp. LF-1]|uniref:hypothetical protein n=1 Tax=Brevundimonas sp. LF-1 TaxID=3126100 RepID=UPI0030E4145D